MTLQLVSDQKIAETSSKGNQEKWLDSGIWYKLDQFGYEALAEVFTSQLLEYSNIEAAFPFTFVRYQMERLQVHGRERTGCSSRNFLRDGESIITLAHLFLQYTGLSLFPQYLTLLFEIDGLVLNDDRHLNNIAVLARNDTFDYCPIFDQGAGLLSNVMYNPFEIVPKSLISQAKARPFQTTFNRQVHTMENLCGKQLEIPSFTREQLAQMVMPLLEYYPARDRDLIAGRICETVLVRQKCR